MKTNPPSPPLSRRAFLQLTALSLAALAFRLPKPITPPASEEQFEHPTMLGRATRNAIPVYAEPDPNSARVTRLARDKLVRLFEEVISPHSPPNNLRWYRLAQGFVHSAFIQRVEGGRLQEPLESVPESGLLGEISVPYTQTRYKNRLDQWVRLYRLYFESVHWITAVVPGPDGKPWYRLTDERLRINYEVPARHVRPIPAAELAPLSPEVPESEKWIEIDLATQRLTAYEGDRPVHKTSVASGQRYMETPRGDFAVYLKYPSRHMGDGAITADPRAYELVGVPWVSFFYKSGIALHGAFWHDNFGAPMSHGCVNLRNKDARWLFRWCGPAYNPEVTSRSEWKLSAPGARVVVK